MTIQFQQRLGEQVGGRLSLIAGFLTFAEAIPMIGVMIPVENPGAVAGFAARQAHLTRWPMLAIAIGAAGGYIAGFAIGRMLGPRLRQSWLSHRSDTPNGIGGGFPAPPRR